MAKTERFEVGQVWEWVEARKRRDGSVGHRRLRRALVTGVDRDAETGALEIVEGLPTFAPNTWPPEFENSEGPAKLVLYFGGLAAEERVCLFRDS